VKAWKRDMGRIRELGPDEPHFNSAVERVWDHIERLEMALGHIANRTYPATYVGEVEGMKTYGVPDDASRYAQRILDGELIT